MKMSGRPVSAALTLWVDLARRPLDGSKLGTVGGQRPHLVITASAETLAGLPGAPPAEMAGAGPIPIETAQRLDLLEQKLRTRVAKGGLSEAHMKEILAPMRADIVETNRTFFTLNKQAEDEEAREWLATKGIDVEALLLQANS
jgi:hypothetical protein